VSLEDVRPLERGQWTATRAADIMTPLDRLHTLGPADSAFTAMGLLAEKGVNQVPVVHDGRLLGLVTRDDILKWMVLGPQRRPAGGPDAE
jgi:CBS domain-containing protein